MTNTDTQTTDLPKGWAEVKHFEISEVNIKPDFSKVNEEMEVSFIPMAAVEERTGRFNLDEVRKFKEVKKGYTAFINSSGKTHIRTNQGHPTNVQYQPKKRLGLAESDKCCVTVLVTVGAWLFQ